MITGPAAEEVLPLVAEGGCGQRSEQRTGPNQSDKHECGSGGDILRLTRMMGEDIRRFSRWMGSCVTTRGLLIGYRGYDRDERPMRYPFGHGMGYATLSYDEIDV